jgi:heat-inducible transcriptional repressor
MVTDDGLVRHWPLQLPFPPSSRQLSALNNFLNEQMKGVPIERVPAQVMARLGAMEREFSSLADLAGELMKEVAGAAAPEALYIEGAENILSQADQFGDLKTVQSLMRVIGEKERLAEILEREARDADAQRLPARVRVRIGEEAGLPELKSASLVTHVYRHGDRVVGVLGILGSKRMEYSRMMGLVDYVGLMVESRLREWDEEDAR